MIEFWFLTLITFAPYDVDFIAVPHETYDECIKMGDGLIAGLIETVPGLTERNHKNFTAYVCTVGKQQPDANRARLLI